jgi:hypothetical protein
LPDSIKTILVLHHPGFCSQVNRRLFNPSDHPGGVILRDRPAPDEHLGAFLMDIFYVSHEIHKEVFNQKTGFFEPVFAYFFWANT